MAQWIIKLGNETKATSSGNDITYTFPKNQETTDKVYSITYTSDTSCTATTTFTVHACATPTVAYYLYGNFEVSCDGYNPNVEEMEQRLPYSAFTSNGTFISASTTEDTVDMGYSSVIGCYDGVDARVIRNSVTGATLEDAVPGIVQLTGSCNCLYTITYSLNYTSTSITATIVSIVGNANFDQSEMSKWVEFSPNSDDESPTCGQCDTQTASLSEIVNWKVGDVIYQCSDSSMCEYTGLTITNNINHLSIIQEAPTPTCDDTTRTDYAFNNFNTSLDYDEVSTFLIATSKKQDNPFDPTPDPERAKLTIKEGTTIPTWCGNFSSGVYNPFAYAYSLSASSNTTTETRSGSVILVSPEGCEFEATFTQKALNCDSITSDVADKIRATGGTSQQIGSVNIIDGCIVLTAYTDDNWVTNITSVTASTSQGTTYNFKGDIAASTPTTGSETARTTTLHVKVQLPNGSKCTKDITVTQYVQREVSVSAITDMGTIDCDKYQKITIKFSESVTLKGQFFLSGGSMTYYDFTSSVPGLCVGQPPQPLNEILLGSKDGTMSEFDYILSTATRKYTILPQYSLKLPTIIYNDAMTPLDKYHFTLVYANY